MTAWYCYDAWCGWCYGFGPVMKRFAETFSAIMPVEVVSGGMILPETPQPIERMAPYIQTAYRQVEERTGIVFGSDYLWHIFNPDKSDWFPSSEKAAIALCILKEIHPQKQLAFASALQYALLYEGRDLCDDEAYRHLLPEFELPEADFYTRLHAPEYKKLAEEDFAICRQLKVTGFPALFLQSDNNKFYQVAAGYTAYETLEARVLSVLREENALPPGFTANHNR